MIIISYAFKLPHPDSYKYCSLFTQLFLCTLEFVSEMGWKHEYISMPKQQIKHYV